MANTSSAKKAIRKQKSNFIKNLRRHRAYREARKAVLEAIKAGEKDAANQAMVQFQKAVDKAAKKGGPLHKNTAARYKSRLNQQLVAAFS